MAEIVEELIAQPFAFVGAWHKTGNVEKLYRYATLAVDASTVVGFTAVGNIVALAGAVDLKVANSPLRIDGSKSEVGIKLLGAQIRVQE